MPPENSPNGISCILRTATDLVYSQIGFQISNLQIENESQEYAACTFGLNKLKIKHRLAKITPTKTGQFVTIWKRTEAGITAPFADLDEFDLLIISVNDAARSGQFIFPKATLIQHKIITVNGTGGKRGIRVYAPWDVVSNKQAAKTQEWQAACFLQIDINGNTDLARAAKLIGNAIK
ncbi:MepB family protein [uncultured Pedobacter sp.]|uniref:MepB family protein n=1 Tax=uncultured Pedobacter sp. TaxID=246139 RepID=UPI00260053DD|nr:MepB family protein [uncultured Pedobacter sp.]